jgi:hypothetical protein
MRTCRAVAAISTQLSRTLLHSPGTFAPHPGSVNRSWTTALLAALVLTVCALPSAADAEAKKPSSPPVAFLLLDELPADTLLDRPGHIDAVRYPSFAALARDSSWFPNAQAVSDMTVRAVPAILDGRWPRRGLGRGHGTHRNNLFTLAAAHGYRLNVREVLTRSARGGCAEQRPLVPTGNGRA